MAELISQELKKRLTVQQKLDWLREQIEMRTRGLQWVEFKKAWSSSADENIGSIDELTEHLKEILLAERERRARGELPKHAPAPVLKRKTFRELGTRSSQAIELMGSSTELSADELRKASERERERLDEAGEMDSNGDRQPLLAPPFESLVGKELDIRWRYWITETGENGKPKRRQQYIWCTGVVCEVADGKTTRRSAKCKSVLPWGAVRMRWAADAEFEEDETFSWTALVEADWNKEVHLGWRYSAAELQRSSPARAMHNLLPCL